MAKRIVLLQTLPNSTKELLASFDDDIAIFNYGIEQGREHRNLWDIYQKKIKKQVILIFSRIGSCL